VRVLVTGASGFLGWRTSTLFAESGHDVVRLARPGGAARAAPEESKLVRADAGGAEARTLVGECDVVVHFAGVPDPARARADPARAVRENAGTTASLLEACAEHGVALIYPSTVRAAVEPPPDPYALSKRLGEEACRHHTARTTVVRVPSCFGPGQVAWEGATGAIAAFAARALEGAPIVIPGDPARTRDFVYVDDLVAGLELLASEGPWDETLAVVTGAPTSLREAAELVLRAAGSSAPIETHAGELPGAENQSYSSQPDGARLAFRGRPLEEGVQLYVDWLRRHPAAEGRAGA